MKVSMISTVRNEERNIRKFIDSVIKQTKKPDEFIIVDGGSGDKTFNILKQYSKKYSWIKGYQLVGTNIAEGRNYAINKAKGEIIFTSDSSTIFEKKWVEKILKGFEKGADVVFGIYYVEPQNIIEKFLVSRLPNWNKVDPNKFLPSNRHVAFKKIVWEKIGGFPEHLKRADDTWFHLKAHGLRFKYAFIKNTKVCWLLNRNLKSMLKLAFLDSKTEGFSFMFIKRKIYFVELFLLVLTIFLIFVGIFINWKILIYFILVGLFLSVLIGGYGTYRKTKNLLVSILGIPLTILLYFTHIFGLVAGIIQRSYRKKEV